MNLSLLGLTYGLAGNNGVHRMAAVNVSSAGSGAGEGATVTRALWGPLVGHGRLARQVHGHAEGAAVQSQWLHDGQVRVQYFAGESAPGHCSDSDSDRW